MPARILVVDDEQAIVLALCETLRAEGYETEGVTSAPAALEALAHRSFDLLLTDLMMPEMDGVALTLAATELDPDLVSVLITGHGTIDTAVKAMQSGALDYIRKPFNRSALLPAVARGIAVRRLRRERTALEHGLWERTRELEVANQELQSFAHSVAHDLRAPLDAITGFTAVLSDSAAALSENRARELAARVHANALLMGRLFDDLTALSQTARGELRRSDVDLSAMAIDILAALKNREPGRSISIHVEPGIRVQGDAGLLRLAFENLLGNAWKYTRKCVEPRIELRTERDSDEAPVYAVWDNGAGFDMNYAYKLFRPFHRLHTANEFPGTGIGLSIVRRVVDRHGGCIWAEGNEGRGACFRLTLTPRQPPARSAKTNGEWKISLG